MSERLQRNARPLPLILVLAAGAITVVGFWALIEFDESLREIGSWPIYVALAALYILTQVFVEGLLGIFWESNKLLSKLFAVALIVVFYVIWYR